jgi:hypothetical protein
MTSTTIETSEAVGTAERGPKPLTEGKQPAGILVGLWAFVVIPLIAFAVAIPVAWGGWLGWNDIAIFVALYFVSGWGVTVGFHRYLTHSSFKAKRWLRVTLAVSGSLAIQGSPTQWVADHRRHHQYSDLEGDPHSPWRYGATMWGLTKGLFHAQGHPKGRQALPVARGALSGLARDRGWPGDDVVEGRADRVLLGGPGPHRLPAPRDLGDQLRVPRLWRAPVRDA